MSDNRTELESVPAIRADILTRFQPGQSGNPSGRPKAKPVTDALRKILETKADEVDDFKPENGAEALAYAQYVEATTGKVKTFAANFITDRVEGKVVDHEDSRGNITFNVVVSAPRPTKQLDGD